MIAASAFVLAAAVLAADYLRYSTLHPLKPCSFNKGKNGLWLRYYWYAGKQNSADFKSMVERLRENEIQYAYFHVLTALPDGHLHLHKLAEAKRITNEVHMNAAPTKAIAWLYIGAFGPNGGIDLGNAEVRKNLVSEAIWLTKDCGFDGVQWDYEFAQDGGRNLLQLLAETRTALARDKLLSVATPMWYPGTLWGWSDEYFKQVARHCDQIAVMCYDSYAYLPRTYAWIVSHQAIHVTNDCFSSNPNCKVILGLPTYEDITLAHHGFSESLGNALRGACHGLSDKRAKPDACDGIALFADYTTDATEWHEYEKFWLHR